MHVQSQASPIHLPYHNVNKFVLIVSNLPRAKLSQSQQKRPKSPNGPYYTTIDDRQQGGQTGTAATALLNSILLPGITQRAAAGKALLWFFIINTRPCIYFL